MTAVCLALSISLQQTQAYQGPRVSVKPVYCVAAGAQAPSAEDTAAFLRHLRIAQARYFELLLGLDTFQLAKAVDVWHCPSLASEIVKQPNGAAEFVVKGLMKRDRVTRWTCSSIYVVVFVGTGSFPPGGGGRPINGGHDKGGGVIILSNEAMKTAPNVQSTLQHELGHAFGLLHVDVYGYDMTTNPSLMAYNPGHLTSFFQSSPTPGQLIPEDLRALGQNKWVFPGFQFDPKRDVPSGYKLQPDVQLGPMQLD